MSFTQSAKLVPLSNGGIQIVNASGTVLLSITSAGAVTFGAAATTGALTLQSVTTTERNALTAVAGMVVFNSTTSKLNFYTGAAWEAVTSA